MAVVLNLFTIGVKSLGGWQVGVLVVVGYRVVVWIGVTDVLCIVIVAGSCVDGCISVRL